MGQNSERGESPACLITDVQHNFASWCNTANAVEIKIVTTGGDFTIWCETQAQDNGRLLVEFGRGKRRVCHGVEKD